MLFTLARLDCQNILILHLNRELLVDPVSTLIPVPVPTRSDAELE
jgi:hypothetical protein